MNDWWHKFAKFVDHYRYTFVALIIGLLLFSSMVITIGCQSQTPGLLGDEPVTRAELDTQALKVNQSLESERAQLEAALNTFNAQVAYQQEAYENKVAELDRQDEIRSQVFTGIVGIGQGLLTQTMSIPEGVTAGVGVLGALFGVGATLDSKRKDRVIIAKKQNDSSTSSG